ncbi:MAG: 5-formyltetrahydrofolate cyclo-ligase [Angelakisella sp.]
MIATVKGQTMTEEREQKDRLRMTLLGRRKKIATRDRCIWNSDIGLNLLRLPEYIAADKVLIYLSTPWEVSTKIPIAHAMGVGKTVAVPRWGEGRMEFCHFTDYSLLTPGRKGILQPTPGVPVLEDMSNAICIVPALAADLHGMRIGYGGGYYDRFLESFGGTSVILAYDSMVKVSLPNEPHDLPVNIIITQSEVIRVNKGDNL